MRQPKRDDLNLGQVRASAAVESESPALIGKVADATAHRDREALDGSIARLLLDFLDARRVTLFRLIEDESGVRMARRACVQMNNPDAARDLSLDLQSLPLVSDHNWWRECMESARCVHVIDHSGTHVSVFPIEERGRVIGMLEVIAMERMPARDATLVQGMLRILKNQLALLEYGESDTLTGLLNRKTFETRLHKVAARLRENESQRVSKSDQACWLGLLDVDHFKAINDNYGHLFGDEVLLLVSQIMRDTFRGADALFRFGGEEFVILLEQADERGASIAFERLRRAVEGFSFPQSARVTVSMGYTRIKLQDVPTTCVERADAALYFAKHHGRNNVRQFETLVAAGDLKAADKEGDVELF